MPTCQKHLAQKINLGAILQYLHSWLCPIFGDRHCAAGWCFECPVVTPQIFLAGDKKTLTLYVR